MFMNYESHILSMTDDLPQYGVNVIWAGMLKAMPNYVCKPRMLDDYYLLYISEGAGSYRTKGNTYELKKGDLFFLFPGVIHSYKTDKNNLMEQWWIGFNGVKALETLNGLKVSPEHPVLNTGRQWMFVYDMMKKILTEAANNCSGSGVKCTGYVLQLIGELLSERNMETTGLIELKSPKVHPIERALSYIEANYMNHITINQVASYSTLSKAYFSTKFKEEEGMSPKAYLTKFRLEQACYCLECSQLSVKDIAHSVGFHDPLHFTKVFTSKYQCSPTQYRKNHEKEKKKK